MLKFVKGLLIAVGIVLIVATIILMVWDIFQINHLVTTANAANLATNSNPRYWVVLAIAGGLVGGFALGCGVAMPKRTFKQRLQDQSAPAAGSASSGASGSSGSASIPPIAYSGNSSSDPFSA